MNNLSRCAIIDVNVCKCLQSMGINTVPQVEDIWLTLIKSKSNRNRKVK